ncbi:MAG: putative DNA binding domain-containing protein [Tannerellaceae bacterium]|nr:putative DNA binding domain-containing protein [Tannerellaceae bacterium]
MNGRDLTRIIDKGEGPLVEFYGCIANLPDLVFHSICSFLNKEGGTVILGVQNSGIITGISEAYVDEILKRLSDTLKEAFHPEALLTPEVVDIDGKKTIYIKIPKSPQVHRYRNKVFDRIGNDINDITYSQTLIEHIYLRKQKESSENIVCPFLKMLDFDENAFKTMRKYIALSNPNHPWLDLTNEEVLRAAGFWRKDTINNKEGFILAAVLLFGKEVTIQNHCPTIHRTDAIYRNIRYEKFLTPDSLYPESKYDDRDIIYSNLIDSYLRLMNFVQRNLPDKIVLDSRHNEVSVRDGLFNEVITNLLVHREYMHKPSSRLLIFADKVITENWTRSVHNGAITLDNFDSQTKNPLITKVFQEMNWIEEAGSGKKNIQKYAPSYFGKHEIEIQSGDKFIFSITYEQIRENNEDEPVAEIGPPVVPEEKLSHAQPQKSDNEVPGLSYGSSVPFFRMSQACPKIDISYVDKAEQILEACVTPQPIQVMMNLVRQSNRTRFRQNIILPLLEEGLLAMRIPTKPSSPLQKYYTTEKGKKVLAE